MRERSDKRKPMTKRTKIAPRSPFKRASDEFLFVASAELGVRMDEIQADALAKEVRALRSVEQAAQTLCRALARLRRASREDR